MARFSALIVEDDEGLRDSLGLLVTREGYDVQFASDRAQAQRMLTGANFDVVLLDIGLPDVDGFVVAERLAAADDAPSVVLISSRDQEAYRDRVRTSPVAGFIVCTQGQ